MNAKQVGLLRGWIRDQLDRDIKQLRDSAHGHDQILEEIENTMVVRRIISKTFKIDLGGTKDDDEVTK